MSLQYKILFGLLVIEMNILLSVGFQYQDPLSIDDLTSLFGEDDCIEGTLSATEAGLPIINPLSFVDSETPTAYTSDNTSLLNALGKSPMSSVNELAEFNNIKSEYTLTNEDGPPHKRKFGVSLKLGEEDYFAEGTTIKKAQHEAARLALNSTSYKHPPSKEIKSKTPKSNASPVNQLDNWAYNHGATTVSYTFSQPFELTDKEDKGTSHKGMYLKDANVHKVSVEIGEEEFEGEGSSQEVAKQNAASNALKQLHQFEGFCMLDDSIKSVFTKLFNSDFDNYSPVSIINEFASKSKLPTTFDLVREEGPPHIKNFIYKCRVGNNFESFGEGTNKKDAKRNAAENMIEKLKSYKAYNAVDCGRILKKKKKKRKAKNLIKSVTKSYSEEEEDPDYSISLNKDPVSKLMEIQKKKNDIPIFRLVEERGQINKEFFFEVVVGDFSFVGSGPNKKIAKKKAAEGMLQKLGYSSEYGSTRMYSSDHRKKKFIENDTSSKKKMLSPGININSNKFVKIDDNNNIKTHSQNQEEHTSQKIKDITKDNPTESKHQKLSSDKKPKAKLVSLAQELGFRFQFSDFPKVNNTGFVSLLSITTDPPKVCYGTGITSESSQDVAALKALGTLYKSQLDLVSQMLREPDVPTPVPVDDKILIETVIVQDTE